MCMFLKGLCTLFFNMLTQEKWFLGYIKLYHHFISQSFDSSTVKKPTESQRYSVPKISDEVYGEEEYGESN